MLLEEAALRALKSSPLGSSTNLSERVREGDLILLYQDARRKWVTFASNSRFHTHRGFVNLEELYGKPYGDTVNTSLGHSLWVFRPRMVDLVETFDRPTQILYPKDIGYALYQLGLKPGSRVVEVGTGSGAMTSAMARIIAPSGRIYSYETSPDFLEVAMKNLEKTGMSSLVTFHGKDPSNGFEESDVDAAILDLGDPWRVAAAASKALVGGGTLAAFTPTFNQLEKISTSLRENGFLILEAVEILLRQLKTEAGKVRPESRMVGHTAFVTIARKVIGKD